MAEVRRSHSFLQSLSFAWQGLTWAVSTQRNLQIHWVSAALVAWVATAMPLSGFENAVLLLCCATVIAAELANSALEQVVDLASPEVNTLAKHAKDASAAAVAVLASSAVLTLSTLLWNQRDWIATHQAQILHQVLWGGLYVVMLGLLMVRGNGPTALRWCALIGACTISSVQLTQSQSLSFSAVLLVLPVVAFARPAPNVKKA